MIARAQVLSALLLMSVISLPGKAADNKDTGETAFRPLIEKFEKGHINWQTSEYYAKVDAPVPAEYRGRPVNEAMGEELALRVTRALADSVFLQIVADTRVDAKHRLSQLVKDDSSIRLTGNIRGKELVESRVMTRDGKPLLEATYRVPMRGVNGVFANVFDMAMQARPAMQASPVKIPDATAIDNATGQENTVYVDARGTGLQPALFPCIMDANHVRLLDPLDMGKTHVIENSVVEYQVAPGDQPIVLTPFPADAIVLSATSAERLFLDRLVSPVHADEAKPEKRKRKKRTVMKATEAEGLLKSNIIVGAEDARRIRDAQEKGELVEKPRVIVITDGVVGGTEGRLGYPFSLWALLTAP